MGVDFISKTQKSFRKGLDRSRMELGAPDLLKKEPNCGVRSYAADILENGKLSKGDLLIIRSQEGRFVARQGLDPVAEFNDLPEDVAEALNQPDAETCGTVKEIHEMAATAEISLCETGRAPRGA